MAKIEMDMSEYKAMEEAKDLLKQSLKNERELKDQIKILNDEKIKALEDAKMKVIKTIKHETTEHLMQKRLPHFAMRELLYSMGLSYDLVEKILENNQNNQFDLERISNMFFEKTTSHSMDIESITTTGLDEVKEEITTNIKNNIDNDIKNKLDNAEKLIEKNNIILKENQKIISENNQLKSDKSNMVEQIEKLAEKISTLEDFTSDHDKLDKIKNELKNGFSHWTSKTLLGNIDDILNNKTV
jgi:DNA repair exonuclease SbcCD ATPase subunit